jgi:hypothetical protein
MTVLTATVPAFRPAGRRRSGWRLAGLLALHLVLGFVWVFGAMLIAFDAYGFGPTPAGFGWVAAADVAGWLAAGGLVVWLWVTRRRFALLVPFLWVATALSALVAAAAAYPAPPSSGGLF